MIKKTTLLSLITLLIINICYAQMPSQFNWQNTKAGWVGAGGVDGSAMISSEALIMKVTGNYPQFAYPNLNSGLTLDLNADLYESVTIELKNTSQSNNGVSFRVFQESSEFPVMIFPIDCGANMQSFSSYTIDLSEDSLWTGSDFSKIILRGPTFSVGDTVHWKSMTFNTAVSVGCTDSLACNYDSLALTDDGSCFFQGSSLINCDGTCIENYVLVNDTCLMINAGCTDISACNYDSLANFNDSSCVYASSLTYSFLYNKQGWVQAGGCIFTHDGVEDAALLSVSNNTPVIRSPQELFLDASEYGSVSITIKNMSSSNSFYLQYLQGLNELIDEVSIPIDINMTEYQTYTFSLESLTELGTVDRLAIKGPLQSEIGDSVYFKSVILNKYIDCGECNVDLNNDGVCDNEEINYIDTVFYFDQFENEQISNWNALSFNGVQKLSLEESECQELKIYQTDSDSLPQYGFIEYVLDSTIDVSLNPTVNLRARSDSLINIRIDLVDVYGEKTDGQEFGRITRPITNGVDNYNTMLFTYSDDAFQETNVDKTQIQKLMFFFEYGAPNFPSEIYLDYMSVGDSLINNNSIGLTDIDECDCFVDSFITILGCDSFQSVSGQVYYESVTLNDTLNVIGGCDTIAFYDIVISSSSLSQLTVDTCGEYFWNDMNLIESGNYNFTTTNVMGCDSIIYLELNINPSTNTIDSVVSCDAYLWNGNTYNESGIYYYLNGSNCDSSILDLTVIALETEVYLSNEMLYVDIINGNAPFQYLWSNGQTSSTINPLNSGEFYVITNDINGCSDTAFFNFTPSHIENTNDFSLDIYPNPSSDKINLVSFTHQNYFLKIYDVSYRLISEELILSNHNSIFTKDISSYQKGAYLFEVSSVDDNQKRIFKILKK